MRDQKYFGHICQHSKDCPVYQGTLKIERISNFIIRNVFCNRGHNGWRNCERYKLAEEGVEIPASATPYETNVLVK